MSRIVAIIPARGNSKRLPRKNIIPLCGKPIIAYTIDACIKSGVFTDIIVSTEDQEIAEVSMECGATIHKRDPSLSTDQARIRDVCIAIIDESSKNNEPIDLFCVLQATSALRTKEDIVDSYNEFNNGYDFLLSVTDYFFYPHAAMHKDKDGDFEPFFRELSLKKGQEVPELLAKNGAINWCKVGAFLKTKELVGPNAGLYKMPKFRSIDIDTKDDFIVLDALFRYLHDEQ